mmetsp:Transcript_12151/g.35934  ORF Transcript_12151/g.35934 Transcript_12151/m.35934 type:complete len:431 (-) Transcript_12151:508-1800(-)
MGWRTLRAGPRSHKHLRPDVAHVRLALGEGLVDEARCVAEFDPLLRGEHLVSAARVVDDRGEVLVDVLEARQVLAEDVVRGLSVDFEVSEDVRVKRGARGEVRNDALEEELLRRLGHVPEVAGPHVLFDGDAHDDLEELVAQERAVGVYSVELLDAGRVLLDVLHDEEFVQVLGLAVRRLVVRELAVADELAEGELADDVAVHGALHRGVPHEGSVEQVRVAAEHVLDLRHLLLAAVVVLLVDDHAEALLVEPRPVDLEGAARGLGRVPVGLGVGVLLARREDRVVHGPGLDLLRLGLVVHAQVHHGARLRVKEGLLVWHGAEPHRLVLHGQAVPVGQGPGEARMEHVGGRVLAAGRGREGLHRQPVELKVLAQALGHARLGGVARVHCVFLVAHVVDVRELAVGQGDLGEEALGVARALAALPRHHGGL